MSVWSYFDLPVERPIAQSAILSALDYSGIVDTHASHSTLKPLGSASYMANISLTIAFYVNT